MTGPDPRTAAQRKADTLAKLSAPAADAWVATAGERDPEGARPHLVPLSLAWIDGRVVLAVESGSRTARNIVNGGMTRMALGRTRDVVLIDAVIEQAHDVAEAPPSLATRYAQQSDWDPRDAGDGYVFLVLEPRRIQAWTEVHELAGRTIMRDGSWIV